MRAPCHEQIAKIKEANPNKRGIEISRELGISRQRVSAVLKALGYPVRFKGARKYCVRCGKKLSNQTKGYFCRVCYIDNLQRTSHIRLRCAYCGKGFSRLRGDVNTTLKNGQEHFFCNFNCYTNWRRARGKGNLIKTDICEA